MTSHEPAQCCTIGVKHEGQASGSMKKIGSTETYFAYPKSQETHTAILLLTDVIGHKFINAQLIADQYAANGYFVAMPDLFHGDPLSLNRPENFDLQAWLKHHQPDNVDPVVEEAIKTLRGEYGVKRLGAVGYCFGAKYVVRALAEGGGVDVGYAAHPSFVTAEELEKIKGPFSISAAETDQIFTVEKRHESEVILPKTGQPYQINLFSGCQHGFGCRADLSKKTEKFAKEQAFYQAVQWFDTYLKQ